MNILKINKMRHGSLFSGIGGFDLAAEWMGWENVFHCEWNPFGQKVLKHYWPKAISYNDITKTDFTIHRGTIDIITGGFPCQPYSSAGKRLGKEDERHLWPEMLRCIREIKPRWIVGENVLGLVNWNGGMVFEEVQADLEAEGYEVQPYVLPAAAVNAPHRRDRIWFIAYNNSFRFKRYAEQTGNRSNTKKQIGSNKFCEEQRWNEIWSINAGDSKNRDALHSNCSSEQRKHFSQEGERKFNGPDSGNGFDNFKNFPTQSPICGGNDGLPTELDGITFPKWRNESIKAAGNAIVPQVVHQIFKAIESFNKQNQIK
jgi:DNA (cytosine-5)-methyltransferase 1